MDILKPPPPPKPPEPVPAAVASPPRGAARVAREVEAHKPVVPVLPEPERVPESEPPAEESPVAVASAQTATAGVSEGTAGGAPGLPGGAPGGKALPIVGPSYGAAYLHNAPPKYPAMARRMRLEGTTTVRVLVSADGHPKSVKVQISSGVEILDEAALEAVPHWSFVPARQGDKPVAAEVDVPVRFQLDGTATE